MEDSITAILERFRSTPGGTLKYFRSAEEEFEAAKDNSDQQVGRLRHAIACGCYIEALALRMLGMEGWLRRYVVNAQPQGEEPQQMFGRLLKQCKRLGFDPELIRRLYEFNETRVAAIHHFLIGKTTYEQIYDTLAKSEDLPSQVIVFVARNSGVDLTEELLAKGFQDGDVILDIPTVELEWGTAR